MANPIYFRTDLMHDEHQALGAELQEYIRKDEVMCSEINYLHNKLDQKDLVLAEKDARIEYLLAYIKRLNEELDSWQKESDQK